MTVIDKPYALIPERYYPGKLQILRISKVTEKTITAAEWDAWGNGVWGRETRMNHPGILAQFATQQEVKDAADAALTAFKAHTGEVDAIKVALSIAEAKRYKAWLAALQAKDPPHE